MALMAELLALRAERVQRDEEMVEYRRRLGLLEPMTGSQVLDLVMCAHMVAYDKDSREPFRGLRAPRTFPERMIRDQQTGLWRPETVNERFINKVINEYSWCRILGRLRAACKATRDFCGPEMKDYIRVCSFRHVAHILHASKSSRRFHLVEHLRYPALCGYNSLKPMRVIGETIENLQWPGLNHALIHAPDPEDPEDPEDSEESEESEGAMDVE
jgi:hypothetical protein